jgi:hypothetical protein
VRSRPRLRRGRRGQPRPPLLRRGRLCGLRLGLHRRVRERNGRRLLGFGLYGSETDSTVRRPGSGPQ